MAKEDKLQEILKQFDNECLQRQIDFCPAFAHFYIHLIARDAHDGLDLSQLTACKVKNFLEKTANNYANPNDPTVCNLKINFFFQQCCHLEFEFYKKEYICELGKQMQPLIDGILQYPENSNETQIEDMSTKIQAFIITNYFLGCPKNHVLLKQTRQSLNSVIARGDLRNFVQKLKQHRAEYLQRLTAVVCGILVNNNHGPDGDKENMRDIIVDLKMARKNTLDSLESTLKNCLEYKKYGFRAISEIIELDAVKKMAHCHYPIQKVMKINKFVALFCVHERFLRKLLDCFQKTDYRIELAENKMKCITHKVDDVLKYRTAIDSELIFPHFVQLSEIWFDLVLCLHHLTYINETKAKLDQFITPDLAATFSELVETTQIASVQMPYTVEPTFEQLTASLQKRIDKGCLIKVADSLKNYCSLTIALTGGLLIPSTVQKKLCEDLNLKFGFENIELAKYAERNFEDFVCTLKSVISTSVDLLLLFDLHNDVIMQDFDDITVVSTTKAKSMPTQTEMVVENDLSPANWMNVTWNIWDYHRETIRLANLRKCQTHSTQTNLTYGRRNAQNQADDRRGNV